LTEEVKKKSPKKSTTKSTTKKKEQSPKKATTSKSKVKNKKAKAKNEIVANPPKKKKPAKKTSPASKKTAPKTKTENKLKKEPLPKKSPQAPPPVVPSSEERGDKPMSVVGHLDEFRSRILISLASVIILTIVGFSFSDYLLNFLNEPFLETGQKLNIFNLTGGFVLRLKASVVAALLLSFPIIIFQIWRFIRPAISKKDRNFSRLSLLASILLFYGGMAFVFYGLLPFAIKMLLSFIGQEMLSTIGANDYMSFIFLFSLAMGFLFELPIVVMILTKIGLLSSHFLIQKRKYAVVIIWVIAALITPADILSQILVAVPLMFLYEISIFISKFISIRKRKQNES